MEEKQNQYLGELLLILGKGDGSVLGEISIICSNLLLSVGNKYYNNLPDIEDAVQEFLVLLYEKAPQYRISNNASAWVTTVFQNFILNNLKRKTVEQKCLQQMSVVKNDYVDEKYIENHVFIKEMFSKLTEYEQDLLIFKFWCGCSINDLAKKFKKPKSTIQSQLERIKSKFN